MSKWLEAFGDSRKRLKEAEREIRLLWRQRDAQQSEINQLRQEIEDRTNRGIDAVRVDARFAVKNVEEQVAAKLAEMETPRYDWNQTAENIFRRIASIERQETLIRDKNFQIEQALLLLGVKLQEQTKQGA